MLVGLIGDEIATGPFAGGLIAGAQAAAAEREHALVVMNTGREGDLSVDIGVLEDRHADALIFPAVLPDDHAGGAAAVGLAAAAGHRRIALRAGQEGARARPGRHGRPDQPDAPVSERCAAVTTQARAHQKAKA
jgi:LacI family transcriptional regulator